MIGDTHHVATVAKVLGNTKAAAMRYIPASSLRSGKKSSQATRRKTSTTSTAVALI